MMIWGGGSILAGRKSDILLFFLLFFSKVNLSLSKTKQVVQIRRVYSFGGILAWDPLPKHLP